MVTVLLALGYCWLGPPPMTGTPHWQQSPQRPPALAPLVPAPGRDVGQGVSEQPARPQR